MSTPRRWTLKMCYDCLLVLKGIIDESLINKLKDYFLNLTANNRDLITVSKIADVLEVDYKKAVQVIVRCEENNILKRHFGIRCPECGALIKEVSGPSIEGININECYICDEEIQLKDDDIVILFELTIIQVPFVDGQQRVQDIKEGASVVAREDTWNVYSLYCDLLIEERKNRESEKYKYSKIQKEAVAISRRNRNINISINAVCVVLVVIMLIIIYKKYGFDKLSIFVTFAGFAIPFGCNYIFSQIFPTDYNYIEQKLKYEE